MEKTICEIRGDSRVRLPGSRRLSMHEIRMERGEQGYIVKAIPLVVADCSEGIKERAKLKSQSCKSPAFCNKFPRSRRPITCHSSYEAKPSSCATTSQPCDMVAVHLQAYRPALFGLPRAYQLLDLRSSCMIPGYNNACADIGNSLTGFNGFKKCRK